LTASTSDAAYRHALQVLEDPNRVAGQLIGRDYLSHSSIRTYQRCPLQFYFQYVAGLEPEFKSASLVFGGAIHAAIEQHFLRLLEGERTPTLDRLMHAFDVEWQHSAGDRVRYGRSETPASLRDLAGRMLAAFQAHEVSRLDSSAQLIGIEEELRAPIIADCPDVLGRIDLITATSGALRITDFKTARTGWHAAQVAEAAPQQLLYADLVQPLADSLGCRKIEIRWIVITKARQPVIEQHTLSPEPAQIARTRRIVRRVWQAITQENFYPNPSAMNCATCPYQQACREWEG